MATATRKVELDYTPQEKQIVFHECAADEVLYGGAAGGGKSLAIFWDAVNACINIEGYVAVIFRRTFPELESTHIRKARALPPELGRYNATLHEFQFINGSILEFRYCENENDVYGYQSSEWDALYIDELTHFGEFEYLYLCSRVRTAKKGIRTKVKCGTNPGGRGHVWVKSRFIEPADPFQIWDPPRSDIELQLNIPPKTRCFIPAKIDDNPALVENDPSYRIHLLNLPEDQRRALLEGDWDIYEGQFFSEWRREKHVVRPFVIPDWWFRFGAYDHGFAHNAAFGWFAVDADGNVYMYREFVKNRWTVPDIGAHIKSFKDTSQLAYIMGPRDIWLPPRDGIGPSVAETFSTVGIPFTPAVMDRVAGWGQLHNYLKWRTESLRGKKPEEHEPRLRFFSTCVRTIECIAGLIHDPRKGEDVLKVDCNDKGAGGDDAADMVRYAMMSRPRLGEEPPQEQRFNRFSKRRPTERVSQQDVWNQDA